MISFFIDPFNSQKIFSFIEKVHFPFPISLSLLTRRDISTCSSSYCIVVFSQIDRIDDFISLIQQVPLWRSKVIMMIYEEASDKNGSTLVEFQWGEKLSIIANQLEIISLYWSNSLENLYHSVVNQMSIIQKELAKGFYILSSDKQIVFMSSLLLYLLKKNHPIVLGKSSWKDCLTEESYCLYSNVLERAESPVATLIVINDCWFQLSSEKLPNGLIVGHLNVLDQSNSENAFNHQLNLRNVSLLPALEHDLSHLFFISQANEKQSAFANELTFDYLNALRQVIQYRSIKKMSVGIDNKVSKQLAVVGRNHYIMNLIANHLNDFFMTVSVYYDATTFLESVKKGQIDMSLIYLPLIDYSVDELLYLLSKIDHAMSSVLVGDRVENTLSLLNSTHYKIYPKNIELSVLIDALLE